MERERQRGQEPEHPRIRRGAGQDPAGEERALDFARRPFQVQAEEQASATYPGHAERARATDKIVAHPKRVFDQSLALDHFDVGESGGGDQRSAAETLAVIAGVATTAPIGSPAASPLAKVSTSGVTP